MSEVNEAVERIVLHKANLMKGSRGYDRHIKEVLTEHGVISSETDKEKVKVFVRVFKMGGIDAMVFDVGAALDFRKQKAGVYDWTFQANRAHILRKSFLGE
jgi:hypothetical protein